MKHILLLTNSRHVFTNFESTNSRFFSWFLLNEVEFFYRDWKFLLKMFIFTKKKLSRSFKRKQDIFREKKNSWICRFGIRENMLWATPMLRLSSSTIIFESSKLFVVEVSSRILESKSGYFITGYCQEKRYKRGHRVY